MAGKVYKVVTPSKTSTDRADSNRASHGRKREGVRDNSPTNSENSCASKCKKNYAVHKSDRTNGDKTCLMHGPGHSV